MKRLCRACHDFHDLDEPWPAGCGAHFRTASARSDLPFPRVRSDTMDPIMCMADGKMYDSKSAMSATHKAKGLIEVGNDIPAAMKHAEIRPDRPRVTKSDIAQAVNKVKQGYRPNLPVD